MNTTGESVYRKVAVVENFFDIIYNVHVDLEGRPGKHAGQKRTYRTITETYAFLPREAVTRFLLGCTECQKHPRSPSPVSVLPTPSPSPTLPILHPAAPPVPTPAAPIPQEPPHSDRPCRSPHVDQPSTPQQQSPLQKRGSPAKRRYLNNLSETPKLWSPVDSIEREHDEPPKKRMLMAGNIDYSLPITTTYLKYMRTLGCKDEDAFKFDNKHSPYVSVDLGLPIYPKKRNVVAGRGFYLRETTRFLSPSAGRHILKGLIPTIHRS
ncbi:hypothetical protein NQ317_002089 [Molorchus minor]|uniref:Nucleolar protein 4 n=1 Tax=Molorchus minor TaxID=1323400 RepID=A0ABQ9JQI3_9CUCU|nr:hypothetical protein NQ317_002089 [Molorchus minor]